MWWRVISEKNPDEVYVVSLSDGLTVGRKEGGLILTEDMSISRNHAKFTCYKYKDQENKHRLGLQVQDQGSKYGTYLNSGASKEDRLPKGSPVKLKHGDKILFGVYENIWRVKQDEYVVTVSMLSGAEKKKLSMDLSLIGAKLVSQWTDECSMVIMNSVTITVKVICALATGKPIITPSFVEKFIQSDLVLPDVRTFVPPLVEVNLQDEKIDFGFNSKRRCLFRGKKFYFMSMEQLKKLERPILLAGGECSVWNSTCLDDVCDPANIMMNISAGSNDLLQQFLPIKERLESSFLRVVSDCEIGFAIVYASVHIHCNPTVDMQGRSLSIKDTQQASLQILAPATQPSAPKKKDASIVIPSSSTPFPSTQNKKTSPLTQITSPRKTANCSQSLFSLTKPSLNIDDVIKTEKESPEIVVQSSQTVRCDSERKRQATLLDGFGFKKQESKKAKRLTVNSTQEEECRMFTITRDTELSTKRTRGTKQEEEISQQDLFSFNSEKTVPLPNSSVRGSVNKENIQTSAKSTIRQYRGSEHEDLFMFDSEKSESVPSSSLRRSANRENRNQRNMKPPIRQNRKSQDEDVFILDSEKNESGQNSSLRSSANRENRSQRNLKPQIQQNRKSQDEDLFVFDSEKSESVPNSSLRGSDNRGNRNQRNMKPPIQQNRKSEDEDLFVFDSEKNESVPNSSLRGSFNRNQRNLKPPIQQNRKSEDDDLFVFDSEKENVEKSASSLSTKETRKRLSETQTESRLSKRNKFQNSSESIWETYTNDIRSNVTRVTGVSEDVVTQPAAGRSSLVTSSRNNSPNSSSEFFDVGTIASNQEFISRNKTDQSNVVSLQCNQSKKADELKEDDAHVVINEVFIDLVKPTISPVNSQHNNNNTINFKCFKKNGLRRGIRVDMIGGSDLGVHNAACRDGMNSFLSCNREVVEEMERKSQSQDQMWGLEVPDVVKRKRGRR